MPSISPLSEQQATSIIEVAIREIEGGLAQRGAFDLALVAGPNPAMVKRDLQAYKKRFKKRLEQPRPFTLVPPWSPELVKDWMTRLVQLADLAAASIALRLAGGLPLSADEAGDEVPAPDPRVRWVADEAAGYLMSNLIAGSVPGDAEIWVAGGAAHLRWAWEEWPLLIRKRRRERRRERRTIVGQLRAAGAPGRTAYRYAQRGGEAIGRWEAREARRGAIRDAIAGGRSPAAARKIVYLTMLRHQRQFIEREIAAGTPPAQARSLATASPERWMPTTAEEYQLPKRRRRRTEHSTPQ